MASKLGIPPSAALWKNAPASSAPGAGFKAITKGLIVRTYDDLHGRLDAIQGIVVLTTWRAIQAANGGAVDFTGTDLLAALQTGLPVHIQIQSGYLSPIWSLDLGGARLVLVDPQGDKDGNGNVLLYEVPRWWSTDVAGAVTVTPTAYQLAWDDMMTKVANYDLGLLNAAYAGFTIETHAQIRAIYSHPATTVYTEPMQRGTTMTYPGTTTPLVNPSTGKTNVQVFWEAGLTGEILNGSGVVIGYDPLDFAAIMYPWQASKFKAWFPTTRGLMRCNPKQGWKKYGGVYSTVGDPAGETAVLISAAGSQMGQQLILSNTSLRCTISKLGAKYPTMYNNILASGCPAGFQTATLTRLLDAFNDLPNRQNATNHDAIMGMLAEAYGVTHADAGLTWAATGAAPSDGAIRRVVWAGSDPENFLAGVTACKCNFIELPAGWHNVLTVGDPAIAYYNALLGS